MFISNNIFDTFPGTIEEKEHYFDSCSIDSMFMQLFNTHIDIGSGDIDLCMYPVFPYSKINHLDLEKISNLHLDCRHLVNLIYQRSSMSMWFCDSEFAIRNYAESVSEVDFNFFCSSKVTVFDEFFLFKTFDQEDETSTAYFLSCDYESGVVDWHDREFGIAVQQIF